MENINKFSAILDKDEQVMWAETPVFLPYLLSGIWVGLIQIAMGIGWVLFNEKLVGKGDNDQAQNLFWIFGAIMVAAGGWIILRKLLSYGNTYYAYTNRRVIIRSGIVGANFKTIDYDKISDVEVSINLFERLFNTGTIRFFSGRTTHDSDSNTTSKVYDTWEAIRDPYSIFKKVKEVSVDIKTDYNYPNALRPATNPGYSTKYQPGE